jgi:hypothetical protein
MPSRPGLRQISQQSDGLPCPGVYYREIDDGASLRQSHRKNQQRKKLAMSRLNLLTSSILRSRSFTVILSWVSLLPLTSFAQQYQEINQVSNVGGQGAKFIDPHLINPWGIARSSTGAWWVADEDAHVSTLYNGEGVAVNAQGAPQPLVVTIPHAANAPEGGPAVLFSTAVRTLKLNRANRRSSFLRRLMARSRLGIRR